jgi:8-oxo-dGTP pyrophosphatase MutT (NUDIX family)
MQEGDFLMLFKNEIAFNLPGESAHQKMAPLNRPLSSYALKEAKIIRESAVAVILFRKADEIHCILTQRQEYEGNHSGQISFPGGKKDETDSHLEETARRESFEEIGIPINEGLLLGQLTDVYIPVSGFKVSPFVYFHHELPPLTRNNREVAEIIDFPLFDLKKEDLISQMEMVISTGYTLKNVPYFNLSDKKVWGATAIILSEIKEILLMLD